MSEFSDKKSPLIVLCYAREDIEKVNDIYDRLKQAGFNLWFDVADILGGQNPDIELRKVISGYRTQKSNQQVGLRFDFSHKKLCS